MNIFLLGLGGALGAISRYVIGLWVMKRFNKPFIPVAMLTVNILGSFGLGIFFSVAYGTIPLGSFTEPLYLFLGIGFFGAFTTFSTFSMETVDLLRKKQFLPALIYFALTVFGSIFAFVIGFLIV